MLFTKNSDIVGRGSQLGILMDSIVKIWGPGHMMGELKGHRLNIDYTPGHPSARMNKETNQWENVEIEAYEIVAIDASEGSGSSIEGQLLAYDHKRNVNEFKEIALGDTNLQ